MDRRTVDAKAEVEEVEAETVVTEAEYVVVSEAVVAAMVVLARLKLPTSVAGSGNEARVNR